MAQPDEPKPTPAPKPPAPAAPAAPPPAAAPEFVGRDQWLGAGSKLAEDVVAVEGLGKVLVSEITAKVRAEIMTIQSSGLLTEVGKSIDHLRHQKTLLLAGVIDPASPEGGRTPLFKEGDIDQVMQLGASKVEQIIDAIERLSKLGRYATSAEGNSAPTPSVAGTSG
jgi:hypothetical protein